MNGARCHCIILAFNERKYGMIGSSLQWFLTQSSRIQLLPNNSKRRYEIILLSTGVMFLNVPIISIQMNGSKFLYCKVVWEIESWPGEKLLWLL
jgi:hypothetical protein